MQGTGDPAAEYILAWTHTPTQCEHTLSAYKESNCSKIFTDSGIFVSSQIQNFFSIMFSFPVSCSIRSYGISCIHLQQVLLLAEGPINDVDRLIPVFMSRL